MARWYDGSEPYDISYLDVHPVDPSLPDYQGEVTAAYISLDGEREERAPVDRFSASAVQGPVHLILSESYEDGFVHEHRFLMPTFQPHWTSSSWRLPVGPTTPEQNWAVGRHSVQLYQGEQKVAEVSFEVTP